MDVESWTAMVSRLFCSWHFTFYSVKNLKTIWKRLKWLKWFWTPFVSVLRSALRFPGAPVLPSSFFRRSSVSPEEGVDSAKGCKRGQCSPFPTRISRTGNSPDGAVLIAGLELISTEMPEIWKFCVAVNEFPKFPESIWQKKAFLQTCSFNLTGSSSLVWSTSQRKRMKNRPQISKNERM